MRCVGILQIIFSFLAIDVAGVRASLAYHSNLKILNEITPSGRLSALQKFHSVYTPLSQAVTPAPTMSSSPNNEASSLHPALTSVNITLGLPTGHQLQAAPSSGITLHNACGEGVACQYLSTAARRRVAPISHDPESHQGLTKCSALRLFRPFQLFRHVDPPFPPC